MSKDWTQYDTWDELFKDDIVFEQYIKARSKAHKSFKFNWNKVRQELEPKVADNKFYMGILKCEQDGKTLYVDQISNSVDDQMKYVDTVGHFIFYIFGSSDMLSDNNIYTSLIHSYELRFFGDVYISNYGVFTYYFPIDIRTKILYNGKTLGFYTFSYNVISLWNSFDGMITYKLQDKLNMLKKFGICIHHIPSDKYIKDNNKSYNGTFSNSLTLELELLDEIKKIS